MAGSRSSRKSKMKKANEDANKVLGAFITQGYLRKAGYSIASTSGGGLLASGLSRANSGAAEAALADAQRKLDEFVSAIDADEESDELILYDYIRRAEKYSNHVVQADLRAFELPPAQWNLVKLAAQISAEVYRPPLPEEKKDYYLNASWDGTTKATTLKVVPVAESRAIVVGLRGTASMMDWVMNNNTIPTEAEELMRDDDETTPVVHSGFLNVARKMDKPLATVLKNLLSESPRPEKWDLIFTGHSAGAATAILLYAFMMSTDNTEISALRNDFRNIHCINFGAPPLSVPALTPPQKSLTSLFLSFMNEGDPVVRADRPYVGSLLEVYSSSVPQPPTTSETSEITPTWRLPLPSYFNSGKLVILRDVAPEDAEEVDAKPFTVNQTKLSTTVFGNPAVHRMSEYLNRIMGIWTGRSLERGFSIGHAGSS
ncbi:hypothetical protein RUND412_002790 [Rhizina undulata]